MVNPFRQYAKVGLLLALGVVLLGNRGGCQQMAIEAWEDVQAQLGSHQEQLDSQQDQICDLYEASDLPFPLECIHFPECRDPACNPCLPSDRRAGVCP